MFFVFNMNVFSSTSQNAWQEWDGAHTLRPTPSGPSHPTCEQNNTKSTFFVFNMDVLSSTSQNAWQEWDGAHTLRVTPSGGSHPTCEKTIQNQRFSFSTWTFRRPRRGMCGRSGTRRTLRRERAECRPLSSFLIRI